MSTLTSTVDFRPSELSYITNLKSVNQKFEFHFEDSLVVFPLANSESRSLCFRIKRIRRLIKKTPKSFTEVHSNFQKRSPKTSILTTIVSSTASELQRGCCFSGEKKTNSKVEGGAHEGRLYAGGRKRGLSSPARVKENHLFCSH